MRRARPRQNHRQLVKPDSPVPVPNGLRQRWRHHHIARTPIHNDKVVAQPMHLHKGQSGVYSVAHGAAYKPLTATNPATGQDSSE